MVDRGGVATRVPDMDGVLDTDGALVGAVDVDGVADGCSGVGMMQLLTPAPPRTGSADINRESIQQNA